MIAYLLKSILCSALLIFFYLLVLEKEKMHRFNRWYLVLSLAFSLIVPLISFPVLTPSTTFSPGEFFVSIENSSRQIIHPANAPEEKINYLPMLAMVLYILVTNVLLARFGLNIYRLLYIAKHSRKIRYQQATLVLIKEKTGTYTFFNNIYISESDYGNQHTEKEILFHELAHVRQKHTADVLFIELLRTMMWFNPFLYLYRKAMQLNHEFLADEEVLKTFNNTVAYLHLLLNKAAEKSDLLLTSRFNYLLIKKRLTMMTKKTSPKTILLKKLAVLPCVAVLIFSLSSPTKAQEKLTPAPRVMTPIGSTPGGVSNELLKEYETLSSKVTGKRQQGKPALTDAEKDRLETIFKQMSKEQQKVQVVSFMKPLPPMPVVVPTERQLKDFSDPQQYGVWINGKKVSNEVLANYNSSDFEHVIVSKLYGRAKSSVNYNYQADLMTKEFYQDYRKSTLENTKSIMLVRWNPNDKSGKLYL